MPNRLAAERSPHLLQHANNPVDWYPWGQEAFDAAKAQDRPIFLSIGYSTCHWCHLMERETFGTAAVGALLNGHCVSVKVDREERPDVDRVFLAFLQATIGHGGWPMNVVLTPEGAPIFGATFIPNQAQPPHQGFHSVVEDFGRRWADPTGRAQLRAQAADIQAKMREFLAPGVVAPTELEPFFQPAAADRVLLKGLDDLEAAFDGRFGGFDGRPKFPTPSIFQFLAGMHCRLLERVRQSARRFLANGATFEEPVAAPSTEPEVDLPIGDPRKEVTEEDIDVAQGLRGEAQGLAADGRLEEAVAAITRAILANPCSAALYAVRGELLLRQGHVNAAVRDCNEALRISPVAARPHKVRGKARIKQGRWEEAAMDLAKANQIDYDDDTYALLKELQTDKVPKAIEKRKRLEQQQQIGVTEAKGTHCLHMMMFTLHCISQGGIHDHIGGGFARYSVDEVWHVPRFEKMLYDNAQLAMAFLLAFQVDGRPVFASAVRSAISYVQRELQHPDGGFYAAQHAASREPGAPADAPLREGAFYLWSSEEVTELVRSIHPKAVEIVMAAYGIRPTGNVPPPSDPHGELRGRNVVFLERPLEAVAAEAHLPLEEAARILEQARAAMFERRLTRPRPFRDEKVLTSWNGLMISALARAAQVLGEESYVAAARKAITFVRQRGYHEATGELLHCCDLPPGAPAVGFHADYAFFIQGLLDTYSVVGNPAMLRWALRLQEKADALFGDPTGAYFDGAADPLLAFRTKDDTDGAEPSPNAVTAGNLWRMGHMLQNRDHISRAQTAILAMKRSFLHHPKTCTQVLSALGVCSQPALEVVVTGDPAAAAPLLAPIHALLLPRKVVTFYDPKDTLFQNVEYLRDLPPAAGTSALHFFEDWVPKGRASSPGEVLPLLASLNLV